MANTTYEQSASPTVLQHAESVLIVAGEASADAHGGAVLRELRQMRPNARAFGVGGQAMRSEGLETIVRAEDMALAGLTEVLLALPRMWLIMRRLVKLAKARRPQVAVLIDLPDFNLRLAKRLKALGIPVVYYISPQVWAWRQKRVEQIRQLVSQMLVILPFEKQFYEQHGVPVEFVGHPLVDALPAAPDRQAARAALGLPPDRAPVVALLPGSRRKELTRHLPAMLASIRLLRETFPRLLAVIPVASTIPRALVDGLVRASGVDAVVTDGRATEVLSAADAAIVCSGTATLQTALLARPMIVVYRVSWLTYHILKRLVKVAHIALVNLIAGRRLVPELVQSAFTPANVASNLKQLLTDGTLQTRLTEELMALRQRLGQGGAARRVAETLCGYLQAPAAGSAERSEPSHRNAPPTPTERSDDREQPHGGLHP